MFSGGVAPIRTPADLSGRRVATSDVILQMLIDRNGGAAVAMPVTDWAISMSTGVIDAGIMHINTMRAFGVLDFADTAIIIDGGFVTGVMGFVFSAQVWDSLPADIQQLFLDEATNIRDNQASHNLYMAENHERWFRGEREAEYVYLTDAEVAQWHEAVSGVVDEFLGNMETLGGTQVRELYTAVQRLVAARS